MKLGEKMKKIVFFVITFLLTAQISYAEENIHECIATGEGNYISGGTFEDVGKYKYGTGAYAEKIVGIENNSVTAVWPQHSYIGGYSNQAYCGEKSLNLLQVNPYYPVTFKVTMERGYAYKFSAWVKLNEDSANYKANLLATTNGSDMSGGENIYILKDGYPDEKYKAETIWGGGWSDDMSSFSKTGWRLFERVIYVEESETEGDVTAYMGLAHMGGVFDYLIDDVSLVKIDKKIVIDEGYSKVYAVKGETKVYSFKAESAYFSQSEILWSISGDTEGVSIDEYGNLAVSEGAEGTVKITVKADSDETVNASKTVEIIPEFLPDIDVKINDAEYEDFSPENELYTVDYYGDEKPQVEISGDYEISKNGAGDLITVTDGERTKYYEIFLKPKSYSKNLFYDGGFEEGVVDEAKEELTVRKGTLDITSENVHNGRYALKIGANQYTTLSLKADVESDKMYMVSIWIKNSPESSQKSIFPCFSTENDATIEFYSETDKRFVKGGIFEESNYTRCITVNDEWQKVERLIRVSGNEKDVEMNFGFSIYSGNAEFYVDDVYLYEIELEESNGAYFGAVYKDKNGEFANGITNAESTEIYIYNPNNKDLNIMANIAAFQNGKLTGVTGENKTVSDIAAVISCDLEKLSEKDKIKIFMWNKELTPYIDSVELGG